MDKILINPWKTSTRPGLKKCTWHKKKIMLIWKAFQNKQEWHFSFWNTFFILEILQFFYYAN